MKIQIQPMRRWLAGVAWLLVVSAGHGATYYLNAAHGSDDNPGTSPQAPLRTLARATQLTLHAGDQVLLAAGQKFPGQLAYEKLTGTAAQPIVISSYPAGPETGNAQAMIDARGFVAGVCLKNCAQIKIANLMISADAGGMQPGQIVKTNLRCGVLVVADEPGEFAGFTLTNLTVKDIFYEAPGFVRSSEEVRSANGTQNYGWGIRLLNSAAGTFLRDIFIADCQIENIGHTGLKLTGPSNSLQHVEVQRVQIARTGGPGVQMSGVRGGHFSELDVNRSGSADDTRKWGRGSGLWTWGCDNVIIEKSRFQNANGPGDSAGVHIDYNCRNVIVQYNFSAHNAGGFCEILGNNYNCAYRYNVSVNDGYRVKGRDGAFQEGKTFWLSGYAGDKNPKQGPFNTYFYNNTIYVGSNIVAKISIAPTARGVLIANNIFCFEGRSESVAGDQNKADRFLSAPLQNVVFKNNLFRHSDSWPSDSVLQDQSPIFGDPGFQKAAGLSLENYAPTNATLVRHRSLPIPLLPGDAIGLVGGLKIDRDILGRPIVGNPDLGALEMGKPNNSKLGLR